MIRLVHHSTTYLAEIAHLFDRLDPAYAGTKSALREVNARSTNAGGTASPRHQ